MNNTATHNNRPDQDALADYLKNYVNTPVRSSLIEKLYAILCTLLSYNLGLLGALLAAGFCAGVCGMLFSGVSVIVYDGWVLLAGETASGSSGTGMVSRHHVSVNALFAGAAFATTFVFCVLCLRFFPNKGQVQSVFFLGLAALPGIFAIAGDTHNTNDYTCLLTGFSSLLAIALLVIKFPHKAYLINTISGE